jgi:hypothetical protein
MDDDLEFKYRPPGANIGIQFPGPADEWMARLLERIASFAGSKYWRIGLHRVGWLHPPQAAETESYSRTTPGFWAVHIPTLFKEGIRADAFGPLFSIEDYRIRLSLAEKGYSAVVLTDFPTRALSNASGGGPRFWKSPAIRP